MDENVQGVFEPVEFGGFAQPTTAREAIILHGQVLRQIHNDLKEIKGLVAGQNIRIEYLEKIQNERLELVKASQDVRIDKLESKADKFEGVLLATRVVAGVATISSAITAVITIFSKFA